MRNVPKLRFKGFSDEWKSKKLGSLGEFFKGNGISKADLSEDGEECILYGELYTRYNEVIDKIYSRTNIELNNKVLSKVNDVIIPSSGETAIDIATASCVKRDDVLLGGDLNVFRPKNINGVFISYQLNNSKRNEIAKVAQGASVVHVYNEQLKKIKLDIPSKEEQEKIANFLTKVDKLIEKQDEKVNNLEQYKKGMMQKIFSQEIRFKKDDGGEYLEWEEKTLGELDVVLTRGPFGSSIKKEFMVPKSVNTYKVYEQKHAINKNSEIGEYYINREKYMELKRFEVKPGDFIMSCSGTIGELYKIPQNAEKGVINQALLKIEVGNEISESYFLYAFKNNLENLETKGSGIKNITSVKFLKEKFVIDMPCLEEQNKIANFLYKIEFIVEKEKEKLEELRVWKKGLLQSLFV